MAEMKKLNQENAMLINSALTHFIGEPIIDVSTFDDSIIFQTGNGTLGFMEPNFVGNWDIWIGEEVVYEMEKELYDVIRYDKAKKGGLIDFYKHLKTVSDVHFKYKSKTFLEIIRSSVENLILNYNLPMEGEAVIGSTEVHYQNNQKIKINLN